MKKLSHSLNKTGVLPAIAAAVILLVTAAQWGRATNQTNEMWQSVQERTLDQTGKRTIVPAIYRTVRLDQATLSQALGAAPMEFTRDASQNPIIHLPMPDGTLARFRFEESPVMERGLAEQFPSFKTYRAQGVDDPTATSRFDWLPTGFHGIILSASGTVLIDPYAEGNTTDYITYWKRDAANTASGGWKCDFVDPQLPPHRDGGSPLPAVTSGTQLRSYRLALAADFEYCQAVGGGTVVGSQAAQVLIMNRVNGVYERDVAIHMNIVANNNKIVYAADNNLGGGAAGGCAGACTADNDPYTNNDGATMLDQNQATCDLVIGSANYDIGHVFSTGGGGIAQLGAVCGSSKARGVTGLPNPIGDAFAIDYVAHEMGHQWGGNHTFNTTAGSCGGGNRSGGSAYEVGSGITIMAYAGICGSNDLAAHSIDTFHVKSLEAIVAYSQSGNGNTCAVTTASGNTPPTVTTTGPFNIPKQTPFTLTASGSDPNGDTLTYDWQEYDLGTATTATPNTDADGSARPIFRPYQVSSSPSRTFPAMQYILNNANVPPTFTGGFLTGELLPVITRNMAFQVVARDNRAGAGGINTATANVNVDGNATPFAVTFPNTAVAVQRLTNMTVTWNASGTATNVKVSLSTDGGNTFPTVLAASTANDGSESVQVPDMPTTTARVKVEALNNIYFDVSDANFTISVDAPTPTPPPGPTGTPTPIPSCPPAWTAGPAAPVVAVVRAVGIYFPANGRFYSIGGRTADGAGNEITHPLEYNPATNTWTTTAATLPDNFTNNMACGVMTVGGTPQIYCVGGSNGVATGGVAAPTARVFSYDPATNAITTLTAADNWPGNPTGNTILPGGFAVAANKLYTIGSFGTSTTPPTVSAEVWQFDPNAAVGSRWLARTPLPVARAYVPAATIGGLIYTAGGSNLDAGGLLIDTADSFKYDPVTGIWTPITNIPRATGETRAVVMNNQMWVLGGGRTLPNPGNQVDIYDPNGNTWSAGTPFVTGRRNFPADSDGTTHVWLAGGYDPTPVLVNTMEIFGPGNCSPTPTPVPGTPTPTPTLTPEPGTPTPEPGTPTPAATPTETPTPAGTPTATPNPISQAVNLSTRLVVQTGANVGIGGFIISGNDPVQVLIRGIGPSLVDFGVPNPLANPALELNGENGFVTVTNNDWRDNQEKAIQATGLAPTNDLESAILATLNPGSYTAIISGQGGGVGNALIEVYDLSPAAHSKLGNISTRASVGTGNDIVIAGFILSNGIGADTLVVRGIGPSLTDFGVPNALADPTLEVRDADGAVVTSNDNWQQGDNAAELQALGLAPTNAAESALIATLPPASYTALLSGVGGGTGVGLVEVYDNPVPGVTPTPGPTQTPGATPTPPIGPTPTPEPATPTPGVTVCNENFDGVTAPALPAGWVASNPTAGDGVLFVTTTNSSDSAPNNAFIPDQDGISDKVLDRQMTINSDSPMLTFRNNFNSEFSDGVFWDGGVLEISAPNISGGDFLDFTDSHVGGSCTSGCYTGELSGDASNPLAGRMAWSGNSGGYIDTAINLGPNLIGQTITLRFRFGSDEAAAATGWHIDGLSINGASCQ